MRLLLDPAHKKIRLTDKETSILRYLYRSGEKPVGREELLREVWGYNANVTTHTLGNPHLPLAPEDRARRAKPEAADHRNGRVSAARLR